MQVNVVPNAEKGSIWLFFSEKPDVDLRKYMKEVGAFRWHNLKKAWFNKDSDVARKFITTLEDHGCTVINNGLPAGGTMDGLKASLTPKKGGFGYEPSPHPLGYAEVLKAAHAAGLLAAVQQKPTEQKAGTVIITVAPATQPFCKWLKKARQSLERDPISGAGVIEFPNGVALNGGLVISVLGFNFLDKQSAYADAFVKVLNGNSIKAESALED